MLKFFERRLEPTGPLPDAPPPTLSSPHAVLQFYWHFVRQIPGPIAAVFTTSFFVAITDAAIPVCIGRVVSLVSVQDPQTIWDRAGLQLEGLRKFCDERISNFVLRQAVQNQPESPFLIVLTNQNDRPMEKGTAQLPVIEDQLAL